MKVSVIIPAYNAAATIAETLESLRAQTFPAWEAIVVDDGSTDDTAATATRFADQDARIRVVQQAQAGEAGARNTAVGAARYDWLLFLDADDWILPRYLERMTRALESNPDLDAVHCGWVRVGTDGRKSAEIYCLEPEQVFDASTRYCPFAVHACVVRRSLVEAAGGFDTSLRTCSDWDLWQRVAGSGARFGAVPEALARYRMRPDSAGMKGKQVLIDGLRVIERGHTRGARVAHADGSQLDRSPARRLSAAKLYFACWTAGLVLGRGADARPLLRALERDREPDLDPEQVAQRLFDAALLPTGQTPEAWVELWPAVRRRLDRFLGELEAQAEATGLARRARTALERRVLENAAAPWPLTIGATHAVEVEVTAPIPDLPLPASVERVRCAVTLTGDRLGTLELPVCDGLVAGDVLADAIAAEFAWLILGRFFEQTVYRELRTEPEPGGRSVWRGALRLTGELGKEEQALSSQIHARAGWTIFLQELWGRPDWPRERFDDPQPAGEAAESCRVDQGWLTVEVSAELPDVEVRADLSDVEVAGRELGLAVTVGGAALGVLRLALGGDAPRAQELRAAITIAGGFELCRLAVREGLLGRPLGGSTPLRERLAGAAVTAAPGDQPALAAKPSPDILMAPGWQRAVDRSRPGRTPAVLLARHSPGRIGTSVSRRARLPAAAAAELIEAAAVAGEPVLRLHRWYQRPKRVVYAPDLLWRPLRRQPPDNGGSPPDDARGLPEPARARPPSSDAHPAAVASTERLPILMYHRVAPTGSAATARYRVSPELFDEQLRWLRSAGFTSVSLEDWRAFRDGGVPLPARAVLLTFDDGYGDFSTHAWPSLERHGFSAMIFLVAKEIGGSNRWDRPYGAEDVPLLGWTEIQRLQDEGLEFGSHSTRHLRLTGHSPEDIVREGAQSRAILERGLGRPVTAFAYPHGDEDRVVQHLIGACGYVFGLSTRFAPATAADPLLSLPRIEVTGSDTLTDFIAKVDGSRTAA